MRFIDLRRKKTDSYFNAAIKLGCGPNFVRNRYALFEQMIREQGKEFWFRFWLTFCVHPDIKEVEQFSQELPIRTTSLSQLLHSRFVQASSDAAISYCWKVVFEKTTPVGMTEIIMSEGQFIDESYQFVVVNFACALGEIFYKWLRANDVGTDKSDYWSVPSEYLEPEFTPRELEKFMIKQWGQKLVDLLGVSRSQVPWIRKYVLSKPKSDHKNKLFYTSSDCLRSKAIAKMLKTWLFKAKKIRRAIREIDEKQILVSGKASKKRDKLAVGPRKPSFNLSFHDGKNYEIKREMMEQLEKRARRALKRQEAEKLEKKAKKVSKDKIDWAKKKKMSSHHSDPQLKKKKKQHHSHHKTRSKQSIVLDAATNTDFDNIPPPDGSSNTTTLSDQTSPSCLPRLPLNAFAGVPSHQDVKLRRCFTCNAASLIKMKKCQQCVDEKWSNPRYYCNIVCQTKDWFRRHEREHNMYTQHVLKNCGVYLKNNDVVVKGQSETSGSSETIPNQNPQATF